MGTYIFLHQSCQHNSRNFSNENQEYDDCILYRVKNILLYQKIYMKRSIYKRSRICILIRYRMLNMPERYFTSSFHVSYFNLIGLEKTLLEIVTPNTNHIVEPYFRLEQQWVFRWQFPMLHYHACITYVSFYYKYMYMYIILL